MKLAGVAPIRVAVSGALRCASLDRFAPEAAKLIGARTRAAARRQGAPPARELRNSPICIAPLAQPARLAPRATLGNKDDSCAADERALPIAFARLRKRAAKFTA